MKLIQWSRFSWDLTQLNPVYPEIESRYSMREAVPEDQLAVRNLILSTFTLDPDWNFVFRELRDSFEEAFTSTFPAGKRERAAGVTPCLLITHGSRVVGASILNLRPDAHNHLLTGPCVPMEYRNRGLATALLAQSLLTLKGAGLNIAHALTPQSTPTAEFLYSKFGSTQEPFRRESSALAAS